MGLSCVFVFEDSAEDTGGTPASKGAKQIGMEEVVAAVEEGRTRLEEGAVVLFCRSTSKGTAGVWA